MAYNYNFDTYKVEIAKFFLEVDINRLAPEVSNDEAKEGKPSVPTTTTKLEVASDLAIKPMFEPPAILAPESAIEEA